MSIPLDSFWEMFVLAGGLAGFAWVCARRFDLALCLIIFLAPFYLFKIKIFCIPFNVSEILIWLAFFAWIFKKGYRQIKAKEVFWLVAPALAIFAGAAASTLISQNLIVSAGILKGWFLAPMLFALMLATRARKAETFKKLVLSFVFSAGAAALLSLCFFLAGQKTYDGRLAGFFLSPNHLAMYLAPGFLAGLALLGSAMKKRKLAPKLSLSLIFSAAALYLTFSYAAWLGVAAASFVWMIAASKHWPKIAAVIFLVAVFFFLQAGSAKLSDLFSSPRSSWQSRLVIWQAAGQIIKDDPFLGIGPGMFQEHYLAYQPRFAVPYLEWAVPQPHNIFLAFWLQAGLLGLAGFFWLLINFFKKMFFLLKQKNQLALVLLLPMVCILVHGLADTPYFKNDLALVFWFLAALAASISRKGDAPKEAVAPVGE
jgi:O-antigen ligase